MTAIDAHAGASPPAEGWVGRAVPRLEDAHLLMGRGRYVDDITLPRQLYAAFVRSPHPHAEIASIVASAAREQPGVVAVLTAQDLGDVEPLKPNWIFPGAQARGRLALARDRVRHVGEPVAVVIAESFAQAADAAELVLVDYRSLPFVMDQTAALAADSPRLHADLDDNVAAVMKTGNGGFAAAAAEADLHVAFTLRNQRLIPFPLEGRAVNADFDRGSGRLTLYITQQLPHMLRRMLAGALGFPEHKLRVIVPDVGGGFGPKMHFYPEEVVLSIASRMLGRPVKWTETRRENAVATTHGRDHQMRVEVAAKSDGRIVGLKLDSVANVGAYLSSMGSGVPTFNVGLFVLGVYAIPHAEVTITCAYTNTTPVDAYRGAGRPEAAYLIERTVDRVALELGLDPAEVRRRNFLSPEQLPHRQPTGAPIDTGRYAHTLDVALDTAGYADLRAEQSRLRSEGRLLGIGISNYTETCGVGPGEVTARSGFDRGGFESALVRVHSDGRATVLSGAHSHGQGHVTTFAQITADEIGLPIDQIEVLQGDTDLVPQGIGTFNSRSVVVGGSAVKVAAARVAAKMRQFAAHLLQAEASDVVLEDGAFRSRASNGTVTFAEVARMAWVGHNIPREIGIGLEETEFYHPTAMSAPYGAHIAVVEVDRETGEITLQRYVAVDDCGVIINPLLARGQVHGGLAQGIGQALFEDAAYDTSGAPDLDPAIPRFDLLPRFETSHTVTPSPTNPLGAKGIGEAGTIAAPPAVVNAAIDALWPLGVRELDMPLTPERVLAAIRAADAKEGAR